MSNDLEDRVARLERAVGAAGTNIHEFDTPDQAAAWTKQLEEEAAARVKAAEEEAAARADEQAKAELAQAEAVNKAAADDLKAKQDAAAAGTGAAPAVDASSLPIADYDMQTVESLGPVFETLDAAELDQVEAYEIANANRVGVLDLAAKRHAELDQVAGQ